MREEIERLLMEFFRNDAEKVRVWMESPNPMLGWLVPNKMLEVGRGEKLLKIVRQSLAENDR